jgi:transposase
MNEVKRGRPPVGPAPSKADLIKLYVKGGMSVRDVAAALGCSKDMVHRELKKYMVAIRPPVKRSRLRKLEPATLFADIAEKGVKGAAANSGVSKRTLQYHLVRLRKANEKK